MTVDDVTGAPISGACEVLIKLEDAGGATAGNEGVVAGRAVSDAESSAPWEELSFVPPAFEESWELEVELAEGAAETAVTNQKPKPALTSTRPSNEKNRINITSTHI